MNKKNSGPRILYIDIETAPVLARVWGLYDQTVGLNQIKHDWSLLSWAAKWSDDDKIMYMDQRNAKDIDNDKNILKGIWELLDQAQIVVGQNSKSFDIKKLNAKFIERGLPPPSSYRQIDTLRVAKKHFSFTSFKLEYMAEKLCKKYKKEKHAKFSGFEMWKECLAGNKDAWNEMEKYNKIDVLVLEELYEKLKSWDNSINFNVYNSEETTTCKCGSNKFKRNGYAYTNCAKYQRWKCTSCSHETRDKTNLLSKEKRASLRS